LYFVVFACERFPLKVNPCLAAFFSGFRRRYCFFFLREFPVNLSVLVIF